MHVLELVRGLRGRVDLHLAIGDDEFLADEVRLLGVPVTIVGGLQRDVAAGADLRAIRAIRALSQQFRPHLIHTHSSKAGLIGRLAARSLGIASIHTAHAWSFSDGIPWRRKAWTIPVEAAVARITSRFIVVSDADREVATRFRVARANQVRVVHNGVPDAKIRGKPAANGPITVVMVARMATPKDHDLLVRALAAADPTIQLRLVGGGPDQPAVEALVKQLGLTERVEFLGVRRDVEQLVAGAHVAALISKQEGFPLVILEAMRAGLPVVASDVGGIREAVEAGVTGYLIPRGDVVALTTALNELAATPTLREGLGAAGRRRYEKQFTSAQMCLNTAEVYAELARERGLPLPLPFGKADQGTVQSP